MTLDEFLSWHKDNAKNYKWLLIYGGTCLRANIDDKSYCPMRVFMNVNAPNAINYNEGTHMDSVDINKIISAADNRESSIDFDPDIRKKLLEPCFTE